MNIYMVKIIKYNMTYNEYKNPKQKNSFIKRLINKFFTVVIFTMIVVIISNYSISFRKFIINNVLNNTMDFSKINKLLNKTTNVFKKDEVVSVAGEIEEKDEEYLDGIKYKVKKNSSIFLKNSGIVTFIGKKKGYNNTVIVQQSNGYYAWYGNIKQSIKLYDYVEKGSVIGTSLTDEYYYALFKDDKKVKINED